MANASQAYGYLPSRRALPPLDRYQITLLGDRGSCVRTTFVRPGVQNPQPSESQAVLLSLALVLGLEGQVLVNNTGRKPIALIVTQSGHTDYERTPNCGVRWLPDTLIRSSLIYTIVRQSANVTGITALVGYIGRWLYSRPRGQYFSVSVNYSPTTRSPRLSRTTNLNPQIMQICNPSAGGASLT